MVKIKMTFPNALEAALTVAGGTIPLAQALGVSRETVRLWRLEKMPIAEDRAKQIDELLKPYIQDAAP